MERRVLDGARRYTLYGWAIGEIEPTDGDADIDLADFAAFQNVFTGLP